MTDTSIWMIPSTPVLQPLAHSAHSHSTSAAHSQGQSPVHNYPPHPSTYIYSPQPYLLTLPAHLLHIPTTQAPWIHQSLPPTPRPLTLPGFNFHPQIYFILQFYQSMCTPHSTPWLLSLCLYTYFPYRKCPSIPSVTTGKCLYS